MAFKANFTALSDERSNRTFMELKLYTKLQERSSNTSSNRTFMELKCGKRDA